MKALAFHTPYIIKTMKRMKQMERKLVFFDIDGTLLPFRKSVPEDTQRALALLMENGHIPVVCSGRTQAGIRLVKPIMELNFPGKVLAAGGEIEYQGEVVWRHVIDEKTLDWSTDLLDRAGCGQCLEGPNHLYIPRHCYDEIYSAWSDFLGTGEVFRSYEPHTQPIQKLLAFHSERLRGTEMEAELSQYYQLLYYDFGGVVELVPRVTNKATGIQRFLDLLGMSIEDTYAFGDGPNDLEMLRYVRYGVAMGNAQKEVLEIAPYRTAGCEEGGIYLALKRFGLI